MASLNLEGKRASERDKLIMLVMGWIKASMYDLRKKVGMMSREQVELEDEKIKLRTSSVVAGRKEDSGFGGRGGLG